MTDLEWDRSTDPLAMIQFVADYEHPAVGAVVGEPPPFGSGDDEDLTVLARRRCIRRVDQLLYVGAEERRQILAMALRILLRTWRFVLRSSRACAIKQSIRIRFYAEKLA